MTGAINTVLELDRLGVPVLSVREGWLDTSGPVRPLLVAIFGWVVVTMNAGEYVIARPAVVMEEIPGAPSFQDILSLSVKSRPTTVIKRPARQVAEADLAGNPSTRPIGLGDLVVKRVHLKELVRLLKDRPDVGSDETATSARAAASGARHTPGASVGCGAGTCTAGMSCCPCGDGARLPERDRGRAP